MATLPSSLDRNSSRSIGSVVDSRASTCQAQEQKSEQMDPILDCGAMPSESFAHYDLLASCWRTYQHSLFGGLDEFSENWPQAGMTLNGIAYPLPPSVPRSHVGECSLLPTMTASDSANARNATAPGRSISDGCTLVDWLWLNTEHRRLPPSFGEWIMMFPQGWTEIEPSETPSCPK